MAVQILRLSRTDAKNQHLLVHVSQDGRKTMDLKFIGTEHEHLYHANIKESNVKALQANNYSGNLDDWKEMLKYVFLHGQSQDSIPSSLEGVEAVAAISGKTLTITLRKNIDGITQRLGSIGLDQDDEREEVSPFDWVDTAVTYADGLRSELDAALSSISQLQQQIAQLTQQNDDLVQAKREHEDELLAKFAAMLNAKKLKIRDQQRLLNGAKIDSATAEAVNESRGGSGRKRKAQASRGGKRKTRRSAEPDDDDEMDEAPAPEAIEDYEEERRDEETPPRSETEDEDDLDAGATSRPERTGATQVDAPGGIPPRRELPFSSKGKEPVKATPPATNEDDEEETDDEL